ncbi:MAG: TlpA disulfide reductase family protein [bacterium]|nr:TlpA disulfide reductase family protein [bacterium]
MKRLIFISLVATMLIFALPLAAAAQGSYTMETLGERLSSAADDAAAAAICQEFMEKTEDMDLIRQAQSKWQGIDAPSVRAYSRKMAEENPESARHLYLYGRVVDSDVQKVEIGRKVVDLDAKWPYGYRLMLATYVTKLFTNESGSEVTQKLAAMLPEDGPKFAQLAEIDNGQSYALEFLAAYQVYAKEYAGAKETFDKAKALGGDWPTPLDYVGLLAMAGDFETALADLVSFADQMVTQGQLGADEKEDFLNYYYTSSLYAAEAFEEVIRYKKSKTGWESDEGSLYDIGCAYARSGDPEMSFDFLNQALANGWDRVGHISEDPDLEALHSDARWSGVVEKVNENWIAGKPKRKTETLAEKVDEVAPDWSLEDVNGNMISLASLKGKVLVLDFWATWCGPCRMAMPVIDEFVKDGLKEDVKVFSVNVWEQGKSKPAQFMEENNYDMILLYGDEDLARAYGVSGIPYLCVIDKEGKIRYKHTGYSDGLNEKLIWWTEDLL